ncbi:unnamed protein product, partial [Prorocentrum cordatum]
EATCAPPMSTASLCPELDVDLLEREMFAIMANNSALEATLALGQRADDGAGRAGSPESGGTGAAGPVGACSSEDCRALRAGLEAQLAAAEARADGVAQDYAAKFRQTEQDYTEKFRQVKDICQQLAGQINLAEERAARAELCEVRAREDCEELRRRLAAAGSGGGGPA